MPVKTSNFFLFISRCRGFTKIKKGKTFKLVSDLDPSNSLDSLEVSWVLVLIKLNGVKDLSASLLVTPRDKSVKPAEITEQIKQTDKMALTAFTGVPMALFEKSHIDCLYINENCNDEKGSQLAQNWAKE